MVVLGQVVVAVVEEGVGLHVIKEGLVLGIFRSGAAAIVSPVWGDLLDRVPEVVEQILAQIHCSVCHDVVKG